MDAIVMKKAKELAEELAGQATTLETPAAFASVFHRGAMRLRSNEFYEW